MNGLMDTVKENVVFLLEFLAVVVVIFLIAYIAEKIAAKRSESKERILSTRKVAMIGMFSAISAILMLFEFPMPFAPGFYKLDFSELPVLIGTFAFGPVAGVMIEFCKIVLKLLFKSTSTAFVGELANFTVGCSFIVPASIIYLFRKNKKNAIIGLGLGTLVCVVVGCLLNAFLLLPAYSKAFHMDIEALIAMGTAANKAIDSMLTFVLFATAPLNFLKCGAVSVITMLIYKPISRILKGE